MKAFLEYVADDMVAKYGTDMSRIAVVFPNKRAELFLNDYIVQAACRYAGIGRFRPIQADSGRTPLWSPAYTTISDLFRRHSRLQVTSNRVLLVCKLYKVFVAHTGSNEPLDRFFGWGELLLNDFDDIDKNMVEAAKMFDNLRNLHEYDTTDYLTPEQKATLRRFFDTFNDDNESRVRERFLALWSHLGDIYTDYRQTLRDQGLAYEGMVFRDVVESLTEPNRPGAARSGPDLHTLLSEYDMYLFVGFNMLCKAEQQLFSRLKDEGKARFYWDFDHYYAGPGRTRQGRPWSDTTSTETGIYIERHLSRFPNELDNHDAAIYGNLGRQGQRLTYIGASTDDAQTRYISQWLREDDRHKAGRRTAVVMCDESLLPTIVHCLPPEVKKVNVTTGMPLTQSPLCSFIDCLLSLYTQGYSRKHGTFRLSHVKKVLRHPCAHLLSAQCRSLCDKLINNRMYYPSHDDLCVDTGLTAAFTPIDEHDDNASLLAWLTDIVRIMAKTGAARPGSVQTGQDRHPLLDEALFRVYTLLNSLRTMAVDGDLKVESLTLQRLIRQIMASTTVPFHGEPAEGVQVMGVLETRNLDFDHLLILSCDEGNMPRHTTDVSFIPHALRECYGMTTMRDGAAVYAYHFYRMLQRAGDVTILYNNFSSDEKQAEMSRFMLQLMVESGMDIARKTLRAGQHIRQYEAGPINKTPAMMAKIEKEAKAGPNAGQRYLSPSTINRYMRCQLQFYYNNICGIREPDAEDETDNRMFGNIFHRAAENIYKDQGLVTKELIDDCLKGRIEQAVDDAIAHELFAGDCDTAQSRVGAEGTTEVGPYGRALPLNGMQLIVRQVICEYIGRLLQIDRELAPFTILGLEHEVFSPLTIGTGSNERQVNIKGIIDRLDLITDKKTGRQIVRVVDYKTGGANLSKHHMQSVADIFSDETDENRKPEYYLQAMLYAMLLAENPADIAARVGTDITFSPALLFIRRASLDPILSINEERITDIRTCADEFRAGISGVLQELFDPSIPFMPTTKSDNCEYCPYAMLCRS